MIPPDVDHHHPATNPNSTSQSITDGVSFLFPPLTSVSAFFFLSRESAMHSGPTSRAFSSLGKGTLYGRHATAKDGKHLPFMVTSRSKNTLIIFFFFLTRGLGLRGFFAYFIATGWPEKGRFGKGGKGEGGTWTGFSCFPPLGPAWDLPFSISWGFLLFLTAYWLWPRFWLFHWKTTTLFFSLSSNDQPKKTYTLREPRPTQTSERVGWEKEKKTWKVPPTSTSFFLAPLPKFSPLLRKGKWFIHSGPLVLSLC